MTYQADILSETSQNRYESGLSASISMGSACPSLTTFLRPVAAKTPARGSLPPIPTSSSPLPPRQYRPVRPETDVIHGVSRMGATRLKTAHQGLSSYPMVSQRPLGSNRMQRPMTLPGQTSPTSRYVSLNSGPSTYRQISSNPTVIHSPASHSSVIGGPISPMRGSVAPSVSVMGTHTSSGKKILGEYTTERVQNSQRRILVEETYDEVVVVPQRRLVEKVVDEPETIRQRIVEVEVPQYVERNVEVPQVEYVEVEVPHYETVVMDNVIMQPKIETIERIVEVPKIVYQEKIVEVPTPEYREVEHETIVEVPEEHIETKIVPKYVPQYVEIDVPEIVDVMQEETVDKQIPIPLEQEIHVDLQFPKITAKYATKEVPVYVPRFVEVPIPMDKLDDVTLVQAQEAISILESLQQSEGPVTLAQMEAAVRHIVSQDWDTVINDLDRSEGDKHPWVSNFMTSQIPIRMDAVVEVTADIQALGLSQNSAVTGDVHETGDSLPGPTNAENALDQLTISEEEPERQLSMIEEPHPTKTED